MKQKKKRVEKATCYFYGQEKIRLFVQSVAHFGFTKPSQQNSLAGWNLAFGHLKANGDQVPPDTRSLDDTSTSVLRV